MSGKRCIPSPCSIKSPVGGSASSVSISFSSETTDDQPSTSGCSSMHVTGHDFRKLKKEKVKAYIQQIKSMVPPSKERGKKTGTLKALQHVIDKLKNLKGNKNESKFAAIDDSATGSVSQYSTSSTFRSVGLQSKPQTDSYMVAVTLDCRVESVDPTFLQYLGYPKDSWHGHLLTSFTSRKDIITVNNMLSKNESVFKRFTDPGGTGYQKEKVIYFRLRYYKHLNEGYGLKRPDRYCAFQASVTTQVVDTPPAGEKERFDASGMKKTKHFILKCVPLNSAYVVGSIQKNFAFSTTHTLYCNLNYISNSAITLLGFLPQDLIGLSVFELYHPDDLPYLYTVYQRIVSSKGKAFKSEPYRMRTRNQNWVYVETEWSGSINQLSKWFEYISGQHTVVRVPENPNVFDEESNKSYPIISDEMQLQQQKLQRRIQDLLLQQTTSDDSAIITLPSKPSTPFDAATTSVPSAGTDNTADLDKNKPQSKHKEALMTAGSFVEEVIRYQNDGKVSPAVSHSSSPQIIFDSDTSITYEQLNYSYNIKRFLSSQPKTYHSDSSDKEDSKITNLKDVKDVLDGKHPRLFTSDSDACEDVGFVPVDIPILNPPSFGSSTKVLVSEQEPRETTSPAADEYYEDFIMHKELSQPNQVFSDGQNLYQPVALTPEVLRMHTKFQERLYVQQATSDSSLFELDRGRSSDNSGKSILKSSKRNLPDSGDQNTHSHPLKVPRLDESYMLTSNFQHPEQTAMSNFQSKQQSSYRPSFPLNVSYPKLPAQSTLQNIHSTFQHYQQPKQGLYSQAIPVMQYDPAIRITGHTTTPTVSPINYSSNTTANTLTNTYWPCYTQTGMSFMPTQLVGGTQLMGGFYQPMPGMFQTFATPIPYSTNLPSMTPNRTAGSMAESSTLPPIIQKSPSSMKGPSSMTKHESMKQATKISESSGSTSSQEDTSSSLLYLLETGSYNTNPSTPENMETLRKSKRLPRDPFWLQSTNWSTNIRMKYTVPQKSMKRILKEDKEKLNSLYQPNPLLEQLRDLKTCNNKMPVINEEDDFLIFFDQSTQLNDNGLKEEEEEEEEGIKQEEKTSPQELNEDLDSEIVVFVSAADESPKKSKDPTRKLTKKALKGKSQEQRHPVKAESSDNEDDKSESSSKNSSCLTPSDQRSNEEAASSLKESDGASKESDSGSKESDNGSGEESKPLERPIVKTLEYDSFHELFIPLTLRMSKTNADDHKLPELPRWRIEADMNQNIELNYKMKTKDLANVLEADQRRMNNFQQPSLVQEQLQVLWNEINSQEQSDSNSSSCKNSCYNTTTPTTSTAVTSTTLYPITSKSIDDDQDVKSLQVPSTPSNQETTDSIKKEPSSPVQEQQETDVEMSSSQIKEEPEDVTMSTSQDQDSTNVVEDEQDSANVEMSQTWTQESTSPPHHTLDSKDTTAPPSSSSHTETSSSLRTAAEKSVFEKLFLTSSDEMSFF